MSTNYEILSSDITHNRRLSADSRRLWVMSLERIS